MQNPDFFKDSAIESKTHGPDRLPLPVVPLQEQPVVARPAICMSEVTVQWMPTQTTGSQEIINVFVSRCYASKTPQLVA